MYWNSTSKIKKGKAYAKGPHLRVVCAKKDYSGCVYSDFQFSCVDRLLRLELTLGTHWFSRQVGVPWFEVSADQFREQWQAYFMRMMGDHEVTSESVLSRLESVALTKGQAKATLGFWGLVQAYGWEQSKEMVSRASWYRHVKILRAAGFSDLDISHGKVVSLRTKMIQCQEVHSWDEVTKLVG